MAQVALDNKTAASTGVSPFFLSHGWHASTITTVEPLAAFDNATTANPRQKGEAIVAKLQEAQDFAQSAMAAAQQTQEHYANQHRATPWSFQKGDKVWLNLKNIATTRPTRKLDWTHAKYTVTDTYPGTPHFYKLDVPRGIHNKFHISLLRPAAEDALPSQSRDDAQPPSITTNEGDLEYGIEAILCCRTKRVGGGSRRECLVKWIGYARPTWEPLVDFQDASALDAFEARFGNAMNNNGPLQEYSP